MTGRTQIDRALAQRQSLAQKMLDYSETVATRIEETVKKEITKKDEDGKEIKVTEDVAKLGYIHKTLLKLWRLIVKASAKTLIWIAKLIQWVGECFKVVSKPLSSIYDGLKTRVKSEAIAA